MDYKKRIQVKCNDCGAEWTKRFDSIPTWEGRCRSCAQTRASLAPRRLLASSINGRRIMKKFNNHIPNARHFTSEMVKGDKSNLWRGGISTENNRIRGSKEYADWRTAVFKRDDYTCQECGSRGYKLHADHIKPFAYFPELRLVIGNGRTLCVDCHKKTDTFAGRARKFSKMNVT